MRERRIHLTSCHIDPPPALVPVLKRMTASGITINDLLADSGYAYRTPENWALPVRQLGASPIQDLHPNDQGTQSAHHGATCHNGRLYCPATPPALLDISPLPRAANAEQTSTHDTRRGELAKYKLSPITRHDPDGYHRAICPAAERTHATVKDPATNNLGKGWCRLTGLTPPERPLQGPRQRPPPPSRLPSGPNVNIPTGQT